MKRRLMLLGLAALPLAAIAQQGPGMTPPPPGQPGTGPAPAPAMPGWGNATPEQVDWMGRHIAEARSGSVRIRSRRLTPGSPRSGSSRLTAMSIGAV